MSTQQLSPSFDGQHRQFRNPQEEIIYLRRENQQLREQLDKKDARIKQLESFLHWENKLFATPSISDADKVIGRSLPTIVQKARERAPADDARDDGLVQVYRTEIAKATGKSEDRVGAGLKRMAENGMIKRQFKSGYKNGQPDNAVLIDVTPELLRAEVKSSTRNTGNNQKNFVCKACHSTNTIAERVYRVSCRDCGEVTYLNPARKEDRAFIVDDETAENFEEWYGKVDTTVVEESPPTEEVEVEPEPEPVKMPIPLPVKHRPPSWLIPGTEDWKKQVARNGEQEMYERREAWFAQQETST